MRHFTFYLPAFEFKEVASEIQQTRSFRHELHGIKYVFIPERGEITHGMPTIYTVAPLDTLPFSPDEPRPVWPDPAGEIRGTSFSPLYRSVPDAAKNDQELYALLVLVDAIRGGRAREREMAAKQLQYML